MAGKRDRLLRDAFHQATVASDDVSVVVKQLAVTRIPDTLGDRHADGISETLPERPGRRLDALGVAVLRMARGL